MYRLLLVFGAIGVAILAVGVAEFVYFEPIGQSAGLQAHIVGVFSYDPTNHETSGADRDTFKRSDQFAAVVDWSALPDNITVQAIWYDSFQNVVGSVGPDKPPALKKQTIIPAAVPTDLKYHLPGQYEFVIERVEGGQPVEVLARRLILVERT